MSAGTIQLCALCALPEADHKSGWNTVPDPLFGDAFMHAFITYDQLMRRIANVRFAPMRYVALQYGGGWNDMWFYEDRRV